MAMPMALFVYWLPQSIQSPTLVGLQWVLCHSDTFPSLCVTVCLQNFRSRNQAVCLRSGGHKMGSLHRPLGCEKTRATYRFSCMLTDLTFYSSHLTHPGYPAVHEFPSAAQCIIFTLPDRWGVTVVQVLLVPHSS